MRDWSLIAAAALLLVIVSASALGGAPEEASSPSGSTLDMGETATLSSGDTVTVYSYESPLPLDGPLQPKSGSEISAIDAEFCASPSATVEANRIHTPIKFSLLMPNNITIPWDARARVIGGTSLSPLLPSGSNIFKAGDCVRGYVGFETPQGQEPKFVQYRERPGLPEPIRWAFE